jgi:phage terminase small subunit
MTTQRPRCEGTTTTGRQCRRPASDAGRCAQHPAPPVRDTLPQPPDGLSSAAVALWFSVLEDYELEEHERALLAEACRTLTTCDQLAALVDVEGLTTKGSQGQTVTHPAVAEARQQRLALARLIAQLRLPEGEEDERPSRATSDGRPQRRGGSRGLYAVGS